MTVSTQSPVEIFAFLAARRFRSCEDEWRKGRLLFLDSCHRRSSHSNVAAVRLAGFCKFSRVSLQSGARTLFTELAVSRHG